MVKTYPIAKAIIDESTKKFGKSWKLNEKDLDIFKQYCDVIDVIGKEFDAEAITVYVDEHDMTVGISIEMPDMVIDNPAHVFYELAIRSRGFKVVKCLNEDNIGFCMVFPSLWERV